jgi:hypothetical protein
MGLALAPQTGEQTAALPNPTARALRGPIGSSGAMSWGHRCPTHGNRGPKPVEGRAALAHVGCCVWLWLSEQKNLTLSTYCTIDKYYYVCRGFWRVVRTYLWY